MLQHSSTLSFYFLFTLQYFTVFTNNKYYIKQFLILKLNAVSHSRVSCYFSHMSKTLSYLEYRSTIYLSNTSVLNTASSTRRKHMAKFSLDYEFGRKVVDKNSKHTPIERSPNVKVAFVSIMFAVSFNINNIPSQSSQVFNAQQC